MVRREAPPPAPHAAAVRGGPGLTSDPVRRLAALGLLAAAGPPLAVALASGDTSARVTAALAAWVALHAWAALAVHAALRGLERTPREERRPQLWRALPGFALHALAAVVARPVAASLLGHWVGGLRADPVLALLQWVWVAPVCGVLGRPASGVLAGAVVTLLAADLAWGAALLRE